MKVLLVAVVVLALVLVVWGLLLASDRQAEREHDLKRMREERDMDVLMEYAEQDAAEERATDADRERERDR